MSGSQNVGSYNSPNFVIPATMPSTVPDELKPYLAPVYMAFRNIITVLIQNAGIAPRSPNQAVVSAGDTSAYLANNVHRFYIIASENIAQGAIVNVFNGAGSLFARNANATDNTKPADGFCSQSNGILAGSIGEVILDNGMNSYLSGLTLGARYYLATTPGGITTTAPVAAGNIAQVVGQAMGTGALRFYHEPFVQH